MKDAIQKLREVTGAGVMECKRALEDAGRDFERARALLAERGLLKAAEKGERATGAGSVHAYIHGGGRIGVLVEVRAESDFVVRSEPFQTLVKELAMQISAMDPETVEDFLAQPYIRDPEKTVEALIKETVARVGENIRVERFVRYEV